MKTPRIRTRTPPPWQPDLGNGRYRNPVLHADYSDPDVIRVGKEFWMTASSFGHVPGLPVLRSPDLVHWELVNHALPRLAYPGVPAGHFDMPRHGAGVWAPSIRHHDGLFRIHFPDPDFGIYAVTAADPCGRWSEPVRVLAERGLIDPCPFWDDDGRAYLVHGWAKSRAGVNNRITLVELDAAGTRTLDEGRVVIDADRIKGWRYLEGPKIYKRAGRYYIFAPAGGVVDGYQAVFRADRIHGPYEARVVLAQGRTRINGPHQGAWVDTETGEDWFVHFQDKGAFGRVVHLQPMVWGRDGWPRMGTAAIGRAPMGEPLESARKPTTKPARAKPGAQATSDEFHGSPLALSWQWQANPQRGFYSWRGGRLNLACRAGSASGLYHAPHLLLQKFPAPAFTAVTRLRFQPKHDGEEAGLLVFGYNYCWLGLRRVAGGTKLVQVMRQGANRGGMDQIMSEQRIGEGPVDLRVTIAADGRCRFAFRQGRAPFVTWGEPFLSSVGHWVGAKVGIFAASFRTHAKPSWAAFSWFRVTPAVPEWGPSSRQA